MKNRLLSIGFAALAVLTFIALPARATLIIQDDFSQPNEDTGSHSPYSVYGCNIWDGAPGSAGLSPNYQTTPGHTNLGANLPGGVWKFGGGADQDYDCQETGNLSGYGVTPFYLTGGTSAVCYAHIHNNENVAITTGTYNSSATLTITVNVAPGSGPAYVGFDSALNTSNNFSGLSVSTTGGLSLIISGSQVGSTIPYTGTFSGTTGTQLTFSVNTSTGAISSISFQGSTSSYSFTTTGFTATATSYVALYSGASSEAYFANLSVQSTAGGGGGGGSGSKLIQDDFSQPNAGSPYSVYGVKIWDGAPGGVGLSPNYQTTSGHTNLGANLPGGVWQFGGGADQDYDCQENGNIDGVQDFFVTGGTSAVCCAHVHNNENVAITTGTYNNNNTLTVSINLAPGTGPAYVGFDSALNTSNNFSGLSLGTTGGLSLIISGSQVGSTIPYTGTFSGTTGTLLTFTVNTSTGAISGISLQGSTSSYSFSTSGFTTAATHYVALYSGNSSEAFYANLLVQTGTGGGSGGSAPVINSSLSATGTQGSAFSYQITATNSPTSFGASSLPSGLSVSTSTGVISGTPSATGTTSVTISAINSSGTGTATLTLAVVGSGGGGTAAVRVNDFLNSLGATCHDDQDGSDSIYTTMIQYCHIRNLRAGNAQASGQVTLHNATKVTGTYPGVNFDVGFHGGDVIANDIADAKTVLAAGALTSIEGPNEPNNQPFMYNGAEGGGSNSWLPVAQFQAAVYAAVKADSSLGTSGSNIPVIDISEPGGETDNVGLQFLSISGTTFADYANCHDYVDPTADNKVWEAAVPNESDNGAADAMDGEYFGTTWWNHFTALALGSTPIPMASTEFGWSDSSSDTSSPVTQDQQGKLVLNQYLSQYARGWKYSYVYELRDNDGGNTGYGLFTSSSTAKLSGQYVANMTAILADESSAFTPGSVNFSIPSEPSTVHTLLMQHSNGQYVLAVWDDRPVGEGTDNITVNLGTTYSSVNVFDPIVGTSAQQTNTNVSSVSLSMTDHPMFVVFH